MKILGLVLAGGEGSRMRPLTEDQAKPALPFVNGYRIVDFVLSNLINSGITSIYVLAQYKPQSLIEHIRAGWAHTLRGPGCFVKVVLQEAGLARGPFMGTADAVHRNLHLIARHTPDLVAVFAADHVYRMDVGQMVDAHLKRNLEDVRQIVLRALIARHEPPGEDLPYERLLRDALRGDPALFTRDDSVEAAWRVIDPVLGQVAPVQDYERGSWGPSAAAAIVVGGAGWQDPKPEESSPC